MNANAAELAPVRATAGRAGTVESLAWLVRREFWEHRSLWIAPLAVQGALAVCLLIGRIHADVPFPEGVARAPLRVAIFTILEWASAQPVCLTAAICLGFYLLDALYAERKDRSILFWKSLPVSDELTVASKVLVATVVVPLGVFVLAVLGGLVFAAIVAVRIPGALGWDTVEWLRTELVVLIGIVLGVLWYAPIAGALLLLSAWVRRSPILWAILVPVLAPIFERIGLGTHYIASFESYRLNGIWGKLGQGQEKLFSNFADMHPIGDVLGRLNFHAAFVNIDLWLGVLAAIAMAYAAARIRRYRDDT